MNVNTDGFLAKGNSHKICEDYYIVGENYMILADGCSSCLQTDIGARVLCRTAELFIIDNYDEFEDFNIFEIVDGIIIETVEILKRMRIPYASYATLMFAVYKDYKIYYYSFGDGIIAKNMINDTRYISIIDYPFNAPYYLAYQYLKEDDESYREFYGTLDKEVFYKLSIGKIIDGEVKESTFGDHRDLWHSGIIDAKEIDSLVLMSDGASSFIKDGISFDPIIVVNEINSFKNYKGEFVGRRMNALMKKYKKEGINHYDDLSVVGIKINI
jgi:hypothetical protein